MLRVLGCIAYEHDYRLVAVSVIICVLGCFTSVMLIARGSDLRRQSRRRLALAAAVFGCSVWSLHFVAMLAFTPGQAFVYDFKITVLSAAIASVGAFAGFAVWRGSLPRKMRALLGGTLLALAVTGMHYTGFEAIQASALLLLDPAYIAASFTVSLSFFVIALWRANNLRRRSCQIEVAAWFAFAVFGMHFTGMAGITLSPTLVDTQAGGAFGSTTLAALVGSVSIAILIASLTATLVEQRFSYRMLQELSRMRLMSNLAEEVLLICRDGVVLEVNSAGERLFKASGNDIAGQPLLSLFSQDSLPALDRRTRCDPALRRPEEMACQSADGSRTPVELTCQPIEYLGGPATVIALRDLTIRKRDEAYIQHLARHDPLTDLPNRYSLMERLEIMLETVAQQRSALALVCVDLDRFKQVNDLHGHAAGDDLLIQASKRMLAQIQPTDTLARIGGNEFIMILATEPQPEKVSAVVTRAIEGLCKPFKIGGHRIEIGASAGVALFPDDGTTADSLMRAANAAMYRVKQGGRGALRFYEASMNAHLQARLQLEQELAGAIERDELVLHYQPIVNGATGAIESFEALIRWNNPRRGMVPPVEFIPLAEENGLINQIGKWVIETACREAATWPNLVHVGVNVSPKQFHQSDVCDVITTALQSSSLDPSRLIVEVTEGVLIDDAAKAVAALNQLRDLGIHVALDDFGTGYSSLSYLQLFKFDKFKIDKSFVKKLGQNDDALTLTRSIVNLGHNLGIRVVAEGVETPAQLAILRNLGCDQIQGYLVARPAPLEAFTEKDRVRVLALFGKDYLRLSA